MHYLKNNKIRIPGVIFLILTGYLAVHHFYLASYFFGKPYFFRFIFLASLLLAFYAAAFVCRISHLRINKHVSRLIILLTVYSYFSINFIYFIRAYSQYTSLYIFLSVCIIGILSGMIFSQLGGRISGEKEPIKIKNILLYSVLLVGGYWLPPFPSFEISILITAGCILILSFFVNSKLMVNTGDYYGIILYGFTMVFLLVTIIFYERIVMYECQYRFEDKVIYHQDTGKSDLTITQWKKHYWVYLNDLKNVSTIDDYLYYEPFIIPVSSMLDDLSNVLILGGENGCAIKELLKYHDDISIILIPYDTGMLRIYKENPILQKLNNRSLHSKKITIRKKSIIEFITTSKDTFDLIILDLPDPRDITTNQFYVIEFYDFCKKHLSPGGFIITQSGSPYFTTEAFRSIEITMQSAGFQTLPLHNQVLTLGEWSWIIGSPDRTKNDLKSILNASKFDENKTKWLNRESLTLISSFGKNYIQIDTIEINSLSNPITYKYYLKGTWDLD